MFSVPNQFLNNWNETQTNEEYHADKSAVNSGALKRILKSPATFRSRFHAEKKETEPLRFGKLLHNAVLEPSKFMANYIIQPDFGDQRSPKNRDKKKAWIEDLPKTRIVVTEEDWINLEGMVNSVVGHRDASELLKKGKPETSGYFKDEETGLLCKIRPDFLKFTGDVLVDVKSTINCEAWGFAQHIHKYRYDFSLAMYSAGCEAINGIKIGYRVIIAIEKESPWEVAVYCLGGATNQKADDDYKNALRKLAICCKENKWDKYQTGIQDIDVPSYAFWEA